MVKTISNAAARNTNREGSLKALLAEYQMMAQEKGITIELRDEDGQPVATLVPSA